MSQQMTVEQAIDIMAQVVARRMTNVEFFWDEYPDIGESDWQVIERKVWAMIPAVTRTQMTEAYALLKQRADEWEAATQ